MTINNQINNAGGGVTAAQVQESAFNTSATDTGVADAYVISLSPAITSYADGLMVYFTPANNSTTDYPTIDIDGLGATMISNPQFAGLSRNDIQSGIGCWLQYCAGNGKFILLNPQSSCFNFGTYLNNGYYTTGSDSGTTNAYVVNFSTQPGSGSYSPNPGAQVSFTPANFNTGASTINVQGSGAINIITMGGGALTGGDLVTNKTAYLVYGTNVKGVTGWILQNPQYYGKMIINIQRFTSGSGTYTPTPGTQFIEVEMVAGGGGGGTSWCTAGNAAFGKPGTGGSYLMFSMTAADIGSSLSYSVGSAGAGGTATSTPPAGTNGGDTTFGNWTAGHGIGGASATSAGSIDTVTSAANTNGTGQLIKSILSQSGNGFIVTVSSTWLIAFPLPGTTPLSSAVLSNYFNVTAQTGTASNGFGGGIGQGFGFGGAAGGCAVGSTGTARGGNSQAGGGGVIIVKEYIAR